MAYFRLLVAFLALLGAFPSWAGYAQVTPPPGWSYDPVLKGLYKVQPTTTLRGGAATVEGLLSIGGKMVSVPSSLKFAPTAARAAAGLLWAYPPARVAVSVGGWIAASKVAGWAFDELTGNWLFPDVGVPASDGYVYCSRGSSGSCAGKELFSRPEQLCSSNDAANYEPASPWVKDGAPYYVEPSYNQYGIGDCVFPVRNSQTNETTTSRGIVVQRTTAGACPVGQYLTEGGCVASPPMIVSSRDQFIDDLTETPMPVGVPLELPGDYPVESPRIVPLFTPMGDPVANPDYNDQLPDTVDNPSRLQNGVLIKPAPSASDPWQVEVTPWTRPVPGSMTDVRETQKLSDPSNPASDDYDERPPEPPPGGTSGGVNQSSDFCAKNPGVLACLKLDVGESPGKLPTKEIGEEFEPVGGWAGSASCPAPIVLSYFGIEFSWTPLCDALVWLKPLILAMAWLSAAFILIGRGEA